MNRAGLLRVVRPVLSQGRTLASSSPRDLLLGVVESRLGARTDAEATPRFPTPLIKPDVRLSRIRLSD